MKLGYASQLYYNDFMRLAHVTSKYRAAIIAAAYYNWLKEGSKVCDIGCGTGVVGKYLSDKLKLQLVGVDIDNYLAEKIQFKKMDSPTRLPFTSKEFKYAMFNDVLHHTKYPDQVSLLKESLRVADEVLIFELKPTLVGKLLDFILNKIHNFQMGVPFTYRTRSDWLKLFKDLNLKYQIEKVETPYWYPFSHIAFKVSK